MLRFEIETKLCEVFPGTLKPIESLPEDAPAWAVGEGVRRGVIIEAGKDVVFKETFAGVTLESIQQANVDGRIMNVLLLSCDNEEFLHEFSVFCADFVDPGLDGSHRKETRSNPKNWWNRWRALIGNRYSDNEPHAVWGEMVALETLLIMGHKPAWEGVDGASIDIASDDGCCYEVKTTNRRQNESMVIHGLDQLTPPLGKKLYVIFNRVEPTVSGRTIDEVASSLVSLGYDKVLLETALAKKGLEKGRAARSAAYKLSEQRLYTVDESFPVLRVTSFVGGVLPKGVEPGIQYTITLTGLPYENLIEKRETEHV